MTVGTQQEAELEENVIFRCQMYVDKYIVRSYRFIIVVTSSVTRRIIKAKIIVMY